LCRHYFTAFAIRHPPFAIAIAIGSILALADGMQAPPLSARDSLRFRGATAEFFSGDT
jgi:hypothetical protein